MLPVNHFSVVRLVKIDAMQHAIALRKHNLPQLQLSNALLCGFQLNTQFPYLTYRAVVHGEYADPDDMLSFDKEVIGEKMLEKLFAELTQIQRKFNNNGKLELMTKVEMKQKLGISSPNLADALMMCMHCPALVREETEIYVPSSSGW